MNTRFYCESCGKEVPFNAEMCPTCGKVFSAVKCPVCLYEGRPAEFTQGCPQCGYMSTRMDDPRKPDPAGSHRARAVRPKGKADKGSRARKTRGAAPAWITIWGGFALLLILIILLILLVQRGI